MDSEHRHELKENDLEHFLSNFGEWWKKYGSTLLLWVLLIALVIVGFNLYGNVRSSSHDAAWDDLALTTNPETYPLVAEDHRNKTVKVLANLWGADAQLQQALTTAQADGAGDNPIGPLAQAEGLYKEVLALTDEPLYRANAYLGLASVAESKGQFDEAGKFYDQAIATAGERYAALKMRAEQRKVMLNRIAEPVTFGRTSLLPPEPPAAPAATEQTPAPTEEAAPAQDDASETPATP